MADDPKPEVIEQDMAHTRSSLVEKIAALENQVVATVQSATTAVQETVQSVQSAVQDTTTSVKQGLFGVQEDANKAIHGLTDNVSKVFDVSTHVQNSPLPMVAGAAVVGFVTGLAVFGPRPRSLPRRMSEGTEQRPTPAVSYVPAYAAPQAAVQTHPKEPSWIDELMSRAGKELLKLGEQALSQAVSQAKTSLDQNVPKLVDNLMTAGAERVGLADTSRR